MLRSLRLLALVLITALPALAAPPKPLVFEISFSKELSSSPVDGRVLLVISKDDQQASGLDAFGVGEGLESQQVFGLDVETWQPGVIARVDASAFGYPLESLRDLPPGDYTVQAVLNLYETYHLGNGKVVKLPPDKGEGQHWQTKPGNFLSKPQKLHLDPATSGAISIVFDHQIPPLGQELAAVESLLDWRTITQPASEEDNKWVKHVRIRSELLTKFWGQPTEIGAVVLLPDGWEEHPDAHYPVLISEDHYHRHFFPSFRTTPPDPKLYDSQKALKDSGQQAVQDWTKGRDAERDLQDSGWKLFQDWTSGRLPRVIIVMPQHANPYFDDSYSVNSENLGPYGDAIMHELLPTIEKRYRGIGQGWARTVFGGSTGGWEALGVQVFYPDEINGAWCACPDPIDFRAYGTMNIYEDKNAFFREGPFQKVPLPEKRKTNGILDSTMEQEARYELALGTHSRSGEQWDIWQAVFSPMGGDGYPKPIWDKRTGQIDKSVAAYWRDHADLTYIMKRDWPTLGPKLAGKLHFAVGDMDTWYLNNAVHLTESVLTDPKLFPPANATFDYAPLQPHCYRGVRLDAPRVERLNELPILIWQMVKHIQDTAPAGADLKSWKY
ncbi:MAG TPA: alpha/beta hydrolase-fold protein [Candidatus Acidoferrum sp.]|nr:alpha/beta hydrolase-fold protein [Candidatus Acidoferrum sp.]